MAGWLDTITGLARDNIGGIAAGVAGAVLGSGKNSGGGSQTTSITSVPPWMSDYAQQLLSQANMLAAQPYQQYGGPRVAGLTQDQQDAANMVRGQAGQAGNVVADAMGRVDPNAGQGMLTQAGNYLNNAGGNWLDNSGNFMADYQQHVTNPAVSQAMRTWNEQINPSIQADFAGNKGVGAYGSSAMLKNMTTAGSRLSEVLGDNMAQYLDRGYGHGMNQFNTQNQQQGQLAQIAQGLGQTQQNMNLTGANDMAKLAQQWQQMGLTDANALNAVGQQQQGIDQGAMNVDYSNWLEAQGYGKDQIAYLQSVLQGNAPFTDRTQTGINSSTTYTSPLQAATQGFSLYNAITGGNNNTSPAEQQALQAWMAKNGQTPTIPAQP